jgi:hypothetical protein
MSLALNDNIVLTDLAYEKAKRLGLSLISPHASTPPAAPVRPYLSQQNQMDERVQTPGFTSQPFSARVFESQKGVSEGLLQSQPEADKEPGQLRQQLLAQMATQFPDMNKALLNVIIERVMRRLGVD